MNLINEPGLALLHYQFIKPSLFWTLLMVIINSISIYCIFFWQCLYKSNHVFSSTQNASMHSTTSIKFIQYQARHCSVKFYSLSIKQLYYNLTVVAKLNVIISLPAVKIVVVCKLMSDLIGSEPGS